MENPAPTGDSHPVPLLGAVEARVLACLVEKQATTPDIYPLTLNAVVAACNQKTNRDPVMELDPGEVGHALRELEGKGLVVGSLAARASRYEHRIDQVLGVTPRQRAVLTVLMLRGPQTLGEILVRGERLAEFTGPDDVRAALDRLIQRMPALAVRLPRGPGQREDRYMYLLCGMDAAQAVISHAEAGDAACSNAGTEALAARVTELERLVAELQRRLDAVEAPSSTAAEQG